MLSRRVAGLSELPPAQLVTLTLFYSTYTVVGTGQAPSVFSGGSGTAWQFFLPAGAYRDSGRVNAGATINSYGAGGRYGGAGVCSDCGGILDGTAGDKVIYLGNATILSVILYGSVANTGSPGGNSQDCGGTGAGGAGGWGSDFGGVGQTACDYDSSGGGGGAGSTAINTFGPTLKTKAKGGNGGPGDCEFSCTTLGGTGAGTNVGDTIVVGGGNAVNTSGKIVIEYWT